MSEYARDGKNANSALVVSVDGSDFGSGVFAGMEFQREIEERAFALAGGNYKACGATAGDFIRGQTGLHLQKVAPTYSSVSYTHLPLYGPIAPLNCTR